MRIYHTYPRNKKTVMITTIGHGSKKKLFLKVQMKYSPEFTTVHIKYT